MRTLRVLLVFAIVVVTAAVASFWSFQIVPPGYRGIVIHVGEVQPKTLSEGLAFKIPLWTNIDLISMRIQESSIETRAASRDLQKVHATISLNWRITPERAADVFRQFEGGLSGLSKSVIEKHVHE